MRRKNSQLYKTSTNLILINFSLSLPLNLSLILSDKPLNLSKHPKYWIIKTRLIRLLQMLILHNKFTNSPLIIRMIIRRKSKDRKLKKMRGRVEVILEKRRIL
jgi:hypothetical protein